MNRKIYIVFIFCSLFIACFNHTPPEVLVMSNNTELKNVNTYWMYQGKQFNGYIIEKDKGKIVSKLPVINGKENGIALGWYASGKKSFSVTMKTVTGKIYTWVGMRMTPYLLYTILKMIDSKESKLLITKTVSCGNSYII